MTQLTVTDLENAKKDVDTIAGIANSTANTVTDRLGASRRTYIVTGKRISKC